MTKFMTLILVSIMSVSAMAQFSNDEVPLPPPTGPGNGIPNVPPPPPGERPPVDNPQYPSEPPIPDYPPAPQPPPYATETPYTLGSTQTSKVTPQEFIFYPLVGLDRLYRVQLIGAGGSKKIKIDSIVVNYANGMGSFEITDLNGVLRNGEVKQTYLTGQPVESVIVRAGNTSFWRKSGGFRIDVTAIVQN